MKEAKRKLEERIRRLERELSRELPAALETARAHGDLRENAEYQAAKERQRYVQAELAQLHKRLSELSMVNFDKIPTDRASYGSILKLFNLDTEEEVTYRLVMSEESDFKQGLVSTASPIGRSLMGKVPGDEVVIRTPGGEKNYEVLELETIHDRDETD